MIPIKQAKVERNVDAKDLRLLLEQWKDRVDE
jgi:hypothetical protein